MKTPHSRSYVSARTQSFGSQASNSYWSQACSCESCEGTWSCDHQSWVFIFIIVYTLCDINGKQHSDTSVLSLLPSFSLPDVLCDSANLVWRKGTIWGTVPSSDGLLAEVLWGFSSAVRQMPGGLCTVPKIISLSSLSLATDVTDATLRKAAFG